MDASGTATFTATQGSFDDAGIGAQFTLRNADLQQLAGEFLPKDTAAGIALMGTASAGVSLSGSVRQPQADLTLNVANLHALGESMDH